MVDPIVVFVGLDALPFLFAMDAADTSEAGNGGELFLATEVVVDFVIEKFARPSLRGIFDENGNGERGRFYGRKS